MSHFFETDLHLPIARTLQLEKLAPPERIRALRQEMLALLPKAGTCRLSEEERALLEVPVVDDWYRTGWSMKLSHVGYLIKWNKESSKVTKVTEEALDKASGLFHALSAIGCMVQRLRRDRDDGTLIADLLLTRGVRRIEESVQKRLGELAGKQRTALKRRWAAIAGLKDAPAPGPPAVVLVPGPQGPPRDLVTLGGQLDKEAVHKGSHDLIHLHCDMAIPQLTPDIWDRGERKKAKQRQLDALRKATEPWAASLSRACLSDLYPAEPWLGDHSGVRPESLEMLLAWRDEFALLEGVAAQLEQDVEDTERLGWHYGRSLIRTVFRDFAAAVLSAEPQEGRLQLFHLSSTIRQMRKDPPPRLVGQWIREKRERMEWEWRARLGAPLPDSGPS